MATVGHVNARSCRSASTEGFSVADNQATAPIAASLVDGGATMAYPDLKPTVKKSNAATETIYGVFETFDQGSEDVTVLTGGIQAFQKNGATAATDIGMGIVPAGAAGGQVDVSNTKGVGVVVGRGANNTLWVDLDASDRDST